MTIRQAMTWDGRDVWNLSDAHGRANRQAPKRAVPCVGMGFA